MKIYQSSDQLIGKTPLLELTRVEKAWGAKEQAVCQIRIFKSVRFG